MNTQIYERTLFVCLWRIRNFCCRVYLCASVSVSARVCVCVCVLSEAWNWFGLALHLVQQWRVPRWPALLQQCDACTFLMPTRVCVRLWVHVHELVFVRVPAASLLAGNAGNASGSDPTPFVLLAQPAPVGHWWGVMEGVLVGDGVGWG